MANLGMLVLAVLVFMAISSAAQRSRLISDFTKVDDGFKRAWQLDNPKNVVGEYYSTYADKLYVVGQRRVQSRGDKPGGIVSSWDARRRSWTHQPHSLDIGSAGLVVFSLASYPFMLTYDQPRNGYIRFLRLYYWSDRPGRWSSIPLDIDRWVIASNIRTPIYVSVPDQTGKIAYINANSYVQGRGAQLIKIPVILELRLDLQRNGWPDKAALKLLARIPGDGRNQEIIYSAIKDQSWLHAFAHQNWKVVDRYEVSRRNGASRRFPIEPSVQPRINEPRSDHVSQVKNYVVFFGWVSFGRGGSVPHIWVYDLNRGQWRDHNLAMPDSQLAVDQKGGRVYAVDWDKLQVAILAL